MCEHVVQNKSKQLFKPSTIIESHKWRQRFFFFCCLRIFLRRCYFFLHNSYCHSWKIIWSRFGSNKKLAFPSVEASRYTLIVWRFFQDWLTPARQSTPANPKWPIRSFTQNQHFHWKAEIYSLACYASLKHFPISHSVTYALNPQFCSFVFVSTNLIHFWTKPTSSSSRVSPCSLASS